MNCNFQILSPNAGAHRRCEHMGNRKGYRRDGVSVWFGRRRWQQYNDDNAPDNCNTYNNNHNTNTTKMRELLANLLLFMESSVSLNCCLALKRRNGRRGTTTTRTTHTRATTTQTRATTPKTSATTPPTTNTKHQNIELIQHNATRSLGHIKSKAPKRRNGTPAAITKSNKQHQQPTPNTRTLS